MEKAWFQQFFVDFIPRPPFSSLYRDKKAQ